jgi:hypothetical protein
VRFFLFFDTPFQAPIQQMDELRFLLREHIPCSILLDIFSVRSGVAASARAIIRREAA